MNLPNIFAFFRFLLLNLHFLALLLFLPIEKDALQRWNASLELLFAMPPKRNYLTITFFLDTVPSEYLQSSITTSPEFTVGTG